MIIRIGLGFAVALCTLGSLLAGQSLNPSVPIETHDMKGEVVDEKGRPILKAACTLSGRGLAGREIPVKTDEQGQFEFTGLLPGIYRLTCAAIDHQPVVQENIEVTEEQAPFVQVVLPPEVVVREQVQVTEKAATVEQQGTAPPALITYHQLMTLPLVEQKFTAALPLVPGVIRAPDGRVSIKGTIENQGVLLVDSAETVDPVTGNFSIEIPIDAVESVEVQKSAYMAEYGRFSGGLTLVQTKAPSNNWRYELNDFLPSIRGRNGHIVGIQDDSPRLMFTGPLWKNKISLLESLEYEFNRQPVRGLAYPHNETKKEGWTSFTSLQFILSPQHLLTTNVKIFPQKQQYVNINSLVPQTASADYGQSGFSIGGTDRYLFTSGGILTSLVQFTHFSSYSHGQGPEEMLVTPDGWQGNFFNAWTRDSSQQEALETYEFPHREWRGRHDIKIGGDYVRRRYDGTSRSRPVNLLRPDGSLAERIDFSGPATLSQGDNELAFFYQDHWAFNDQLAVDYGVRFSGQSLGEKAALAPRLGLVFSPTKSGRTIVRSGVGIFYDRLPLLAGDFPENPTRSVSLFDEAGTQVGPTLTYTNAYQRIDEEKGVVIPSPHHLDSTPYNVTWNVRVDHEIRPHVVARLSYLSSRTYDIFFINPQLSASGNPVMLMTNKGASRYHEFESTLRIRPTEKTDFNVSYLYSVARGDLNTLASVFVPFEQPVIRPNYFAPLPTNIPNRLVTWGQFPAPWKITVTPLVDFHTGFPYSNIDVFQNYVGSPNSQRFPAFVSFDLRLSRDFRIPWIPWVKDHLFRGSIQGFNLTNHGNFRDVYNNVASPYFGNFAGFQHRTFDLLLDIVY
jgi:hypothetical protein